MDRSSEPAELKDMDSYSRAGVLTKKDVFRWNIQAPLVLGSEVRSDVFTFGPARNSKFCLMLAKDPEKCEFLQNQFGVCLARTLINSSCDEIAVKVSFALLDTRERLHYACDKIMRDSDRIYATFDSNIFDKHQQIFVRKDGSLTIHCAMDVEEVLMETVKDVKDAKKFQLPGEDYDGAKDLVENLKLLLEQEKFYDVALCVGEKEFRSHRSILGARSPVFSAMFEHNTLEKENNRVVIEDIDADVMHQLLRYVYTGDTDQLEPSLCLSLFAAADKYALPKLKKKCSGFLSSNLTPGMALDVLTMADIHQDETLKQSAVQVVLDHAVQIMETNDWLTFLKEYSELANVIILRLAMKK